MYIHLKRSHNFILAVFKQHVYSFVLKRQNGKECSRDYFIQLSLRWRIPPAIPHVPQAPTTELSFPVWTTGLILGLRSANERRRYFVTASLLLGRKPRISPELETTWGSPSLSHDWWWVWVLFLYMLTRPRLDNQLTLRYKCRKFLGKSWPFTVTS